MVPVVYSNIALYMTVEHNIKSLKHNYFIKGQTFMS